MLTKVLTAGLVTAALLLSATSAHAHFLWLVVVKNTTGQSVVHARFSEAAEEPEPELLKRLEGLQIQHRPQVGELSSLTVKKSAESIEAELPKGFDASPGIVLSEKNFGVTGRGDVKVLLQYYAKLYTGEIAAAQQLGVTKQLKLDIVPVVDGKSLTLQVTWEGKPVADSEVVVKGPGLKGDKIKTDAKGLVKVELVEGGLLEIRARHVETKGGEFEGKPYTEIRHYCSLTMRYLAADKSSVKTAR